ncbi:MAG: 50S ribosomal protein L11 methyltransferase [Chloroflexi bacterium]|nr:50S ribosomal protein L11 methyltransferase [Chloroflexota bacterium]
MNQDKRWIELSVEAEKTAIDDLVILFNRYCSGGAVVEERPEARAVVKGYLPEWERETAQKLEIALLLLGQVASITKPVVRLMAPEDWTESWKAYFEPQHIGQHTVIVPTWREYTPLPGEMVILLDPGMAFGTGLHATTRLCLAALERYIRPGMHALDVGTGSGILSIAMAKQGAALIDAIDTDSVAVHVAQDNFRLNGATQANAAQATLLTAETPAEISIHSGSGYDLVTINIFADVIIAMSHALADVLQSGGTLIASGIIASRADDVALALQQTGFELSERQQEDDWVALIARKA